MSALSIAQGLTASPTWMPPPPATPCSVEPVPSLAKAPMPLESAASPVDTLLPLIDPLSADPWSGLQIYQQQLWKEEAQSSPAGGHHGLDVVS